MNNEFDRLLNEEDEKQMDELTDKHKKNVNVEETPKQINKFAQYVKDNYKSVKKERNLSNHKDVMQELSKNFKTLSTK